MPRIVLDSTVLVSAFLTRGGVSEAVLLEARRGSYSLWLCDEILEETQRVLMEPGRIRQLYHYSDRRAKLYVQGMRRVANMAQKLPHLRGVSRDPFDDVIVACAIKAKAAYLVSRDEDLLSLDRFRSVRMISPEDCIAMLRQK